MRSSPLLQLKPLRCSRGENRATIPGTAEVQTSEVIAPEGTPTHVRIASFSVEQALPFQTTLKVEYQYVTGVRLGRTTNAKPYIELAFFGAFAPPQDDEVMRPRQLCHQWRHD